MIGGQGTAERLMSPTSIVLSASSTVGSKQRASRTIQLGDTDTAPGATVGAKVLAAWLSRASEIVALPS
jgi:hypothetical protein